MKTTNSSKAAKELKRQLLMEIYLEVKAKQGEGNAERSN